MADEDFPKSKRDELRTQLVQMTGKSVSELRSVLGDTQKEIVKNKSSAPTSLVVPNPVAPEIKSTVQGFSGSNQGGMLNRDLQHGTGRGGTGGDQLITTGCVNGVAAAWVALVASQPEAI